MKKIKYLIVVFLFHSTNLLAQNLWRNEISLNFTVQTNTKVASSFVDANGIHLVYSRNGGIKYALVNSQGSAIRYDKVIESEGSGSDFANVVAINNNVYVVYHKNNDIKVARSTNLGNNWSTSFSNRPLVNTGCNKIIAYRDGNYIQITWCERRVGSLDDNDVHYVRFNPSNPPQWDFYKNVSENETYYGGDNPDLAFASGKVEVNYTTLGSPLNRERLSNNSWNNPESIPIHQYPFLYVERIKPMIIDYRKSVKYSLSIFVEWLRILGTIHQPFL